MRLCCWHLSRLGILHGAGAGDQDTEHLRERNGDGLQHPHRSPHRGRGFIARGLAFAFLGKALARPAVTS